MLSKKTVFTLLLLIVISTLVGSVNLAFGVLPIPPGGGTIKSPARHWVDPAELSVDLGNGLSYNDHTFWKIIKGAKVMKTASGVCDQIMSRYKSGIYSYHDIKFDKKRLEVGEDGIVSLGFYAKNLNPSKVDFACVKLISKTDPKGIWAVVKEDGAHTGHFHSMGKIVPFTSITRSGDGIFSPDLRVSESDTITAIFGKDKASVEVVPSTVVAAGGRGGIVAIYSPSLYPAGTPRPACTSDAGDGDGICNEWETGGRLTVTFSGATYYGPVCGGAGQDTCPASNVKDLYLEIDAVAAPSPTNTYAPSSIAVNNVVSAFRDSMGTRVTSGAGTVYPSVYVHVINGPQNIPGYETTQIIFPGDFTTIKENNFYWDAASSKDQKRQAVHYALFAYEISGDIGSSGLGEVWGNDIMITLGNPNFNGGGSGAGTQDEQEGTLMHELGHNLNLKHGGNEDINCKPNYISVMNYIYQFSDLVTGRVLDYSQSAVGKPGSSPLQLQEGTSASLLLDEVSGLTASTPAGKTIAYGISTSPFVATATAGSNINWDDNPHLGTGGPNPTTADVNNFQTITGCGASPSETLKGYKDWANTLKFAYRNSANFEAGREVHDVDIQGMLLSRIFQISNVLQKQPIDHSTKTTLNNYLLEAESDITHYRYQDAFDVLKTMKGQVDHLVTIDSSRLALHSIIDDVRISLRLATPLPSQVTLDTYRYPIGNDALITVEDNEADMHHHSIDNVSVNIRSSSDPIGIPIILTETGADTGIFTGNVKFTGGFTNSAHNELHVSIGDTSVTTYKGYTASAQITISGSPAPTVILPPGVVVDIGPTFHAPSKFIYK